MPEADISTKSSAVKKPATAGLVVRVGKWAWFVGRGTPPVIRRGEEEAAPAPAAEIEPEPWSNVAEWLRRMHAQADLQPRESGPEER